MGEVKQYYKKIDLIRLLACLAILFYHLGILKGGYLAVCVFFVLSGYLSCITAFRQDKFSLQSYYLNRIFKIYLPLVIVLFVTIFVAGLFQNIIWLSLKPETTSILFGYNNFWQISANMDYFARHIDSPFMHFWYISILLQFDLIFPFIYMLFKKVSNKIVLCISAVLLSIGAAIYFCYICTTQSITIAYYDTFSRIFSLLFGMTLGLFHIYFPKLKIILKQEYIQKLTFYLYLIILIILFIFFDAKSQYFVLIMIIVSFIACRLITYATLDTKTPIIVFDKIVKSLSGISYEIYLVQYPVIFFFQYTEITLWVKIPMIIILILILSYILHFCFDLKCHKKFKKMQYFLCFLVLFFTVEGIYQYILAEDHTLEMKKLEEQLTQNEQLIQNKQTEYEENLKKEQEDWLSTLNGLEDSKKELDNIVTNLSIIGVGDSVMLGAVDQLYKQFPNGYFDAKISRTAWAVKPILEELKNENLLGNTIIFNLGANGDCSESCKKEIMDICDGRDVFWINTTNNEQANKQLSIFASNYKNLHIIDWNTISKGHTEYFYADGIHLTEKGKPAYIKVIYNAIYQKYLEEYEQNKKDIMKEHEENLKSKSTFYGNNILVNAFDYIQDKFQDSNFVIDKDFTYYTLKQKVQEAYQNKTLTHKIVFAFDKQLSISLSEYQELLSLCPESKIYILATEELDLSSLQSDSVTVIPFYDKIKAHKNYLLADKQHLSEEGNKALSKLLSDTIK